MENQYTKLVEKGLVDALIYLEELDFNDQIRLLKKVIRTARKDNSGNMDLFFVPVCITLLEECCYHHGLKQNPTKSPNLLRETAKECAKHFLSELPELA